MRKQVNTPLDLVALARGDWILPEHEQSTLGLDVNIGPDLIEGLTHRTAGPALHAHLALGLTALVETKWDGTVLHVHYDGTPMWHIPLPSDTYTLDVHLTKLVRELAALVGSN